ncbi:MAG: imidazoleglycerol-phosphate dehydratase HisB [Rhodobacterales bacterium]|nr:imidazoleglycerol-phosphate dehydratase HisB [Rhodobacterales bacterium]
MTRTAQIRRTTTETDIDLTLTLADVGPNRIETGLGFLDHMLTALARHSGWTLVLKATGDTWVDDHHTVEDVAICLGQAVSNALGERRGIQRFGSAFVPMDEALARVVIDLSGRPAWVVNLGFKREKLGAVATENLTHFFQTLAIELKAAIHVDVLRGENDHHRSEAAFKALALALKAACTSTESDQIPSTKGVL